MMMSKEGGFVMAARFYGTFKMLASKVDNEDQGVGYGRRI
jgi:hypothetical protein